MRSNVSTMVKTYSCGNPRDLVSPSATTLCCLFSTTSSDGGTGSSLFLLFSLCFVQYTEAEERQKWERAGYAYHVNEVRWTVVPDYKYMCI